MIIFLHIPKTAGTSFRFVLENTFGPSHCHAGHTRRSVFNQRDFEFARRFFLGLKSIAGHNLVDPQRLQLPEPSFLTFLREPVSRVISHYQDSVVRGGNRRSFEQCLAEKCGLENLQVKLMAGERNLGKAKLFLERCQMVGLTEQFDLSLHVLKRLCPQPLKLNYRRRVVAADNSVKKTITQDARLLEMAAEYNRLDLELYSFAENEIFPALCEKAGFKPGQKVESFEISEGSPSLKFRVGRLYNKLFRQCCKWVGIRGAGGEEPQFCAVPVQS